MNYNDLEFQVLSCFIQRPEFMETTKLNDKYFINHKRLWIFIKEFYRKFGNFDFSLMYDIVDKKDMFLDYMMRLADFELLPNRFEQYEQRLIDKFEENKKDEFIIHQIYEYANRLYVRSITIDEFKEKINKICEMADKFYEERGN